MTTADTAARPGTRAALGRVAGVLALASAAVHLLLVDVGSLPSLAMVGMAAECLPCAWHLRRTPTTPVWAMTAALDVAMLGLHAQLPVTAHHHGPGALMPVGPALVVIQLAVAAGALLAGRARLAR